MLIGIKWITNEPMQQRITQEASVSMRQIKPYVQNGWTKPENEPAEAGTPKIREMGIFRFPKFRITCIMRNSYD